MADSAVSSLCPFVGEITRMGWSVPADWAGAWIEARQPRKREQRRTAAQRVIIGVKSGIFSLNTAPKQSPLPAGATLTSGGRRDTL
jgi:hypothetical protein